MTTTRRADRTHAVWMLIAALGTVAYWAVYFTSGATRIRADDVYTAFESAFPVADGWMALCYLMAARFLWRRDPRALPWGLCAGSAMIFLGCMDLLFNIEQGNFALLFSGPDDLRAAMAAEVLIVIFCLTFGAFTVRRFIRYPLSKPDL